MRGSDRIGNGSVGVLVMRSGSVISSDEGARRMLGSDRSRIGRIVAPFGGEPPADERMVDRTSGERPVETTEFQLVDVPHRWFEVSRVAADMWPDDLIVILRDVTEERRSRGLHEVVCALLLHELRTPMTTITAAADLLARGPGNGQQGSIGRNAHSGDSSSITSPGNGHGDGPANELVADIVVETRRLELLMDDLTVLADLEPEPVLTPEPTLIQHVLPEIVQADDGGPTGTPIGLTVEPDLPIVLVDGDALERVMATLIGSARRAGTSRRLEVVAQRSGSGVEIRIRRLDQQTPSDPELLGRFGYLLLTRETGTAADLGAHTAYRLIDAMGGRMWSGSMGDAGSEFGIWLPPETTDDD